MPEQWQQFTPLEEFMASEANPDNPVIITACITLAANPPEAWILENYVPLVLKHPRFSSRVVQRGGRFIFEHVEGFTASSTILREHHLQVERTGSASLSRAERQLMFSERLSQIISTDLDRSRPLWKLHYFPGWSIASDASPGQCSTIVARVHHSIADGIGLVKYFSAEVIDKDVSKDLKKFLVVPERQKVSNPEPTVSREQENDKSKPVAAAPLHTATPNALQRAWENLGDAYASTIRVFFPEPKNTFTRSPIQKQKVCALVTPSRFTVSLLKGTSRQFGVTINDVLYTAVSGATRRYLSEYGDDPNDLASLRCVVPFNGHMFDEYKVSDISNQIALVALPLHVHVESTHERLVRCVGTLQRVKRGSQPAITARLLEVLARLPQIVRKPIWRHLTRSASVLFTNVPGPREKVRVGGVEISFIHFFAPADGHAGVVVGLFSYNGQISLSVAGDKGRISDPQRFIDLLGEEVDSLVDLGNNMS